MRRLVLIANPVASGFTASLHREVVATLTGPYDVTAVWPSSAVEARQSARDAAEAGYDVVVAMGGDGVAHQVANGLLGSQTAIGLVPAGTTNVLARVLGIPSKPAPAAGLIADLPGIQEIPVAAIDDDSAAGVRSHVALFNVGVGFDAATVKRAEDKPLSKVSFGSLHYAVSTAAVLLGDYRHREPDLRITIDGTTMQGVSVFVQVHDIHSYFGPRAMRLGRRSSGLTVAVVERMPIVRSIRLVARALSDRPLDSLRGVTVVRGARSLTVEAASGSLLQADGELLGTVGRAQVELSEQPLKVIAAKSRMILRASA